MALVLVDDPPEQGLPPIRVCRNGVPPDARGARHAMGLFHTLAGARLKVLARKMIPPDDTVANAAAGDVTIWRFLCHTSPNHDACRVVYHWVPALGLEAGGAQTAVYLVTTEQDISAQPATAGTATTQSTIYLTERVASSVTTAVGTYVPNDYRTSEQTITLTGNAFHSIDVHVQQYARLIGIEIHETTWARRRLNTATAGVLAVDTSAMVIGGPIYDRDIADWWTDAYTLWKRGGSQLVGYAVNGQSGTSLIGTTETNVLTGTTTYGTTASAGLWTWPKDRNALNNSNQVPVVLYAYASETAGAGSARFRDQANNIIGTIGSIGTTAGWYTTTATLNSAISGGAQKIDLTHFASAASPTAITYYAGGVIEYLA